MIFITFVFDGEESMDIIAFDFQNIYFIGWLAGEK